MSRRLADSSITPASESGSQRSLVAILTGGGDRPYALGLAECLIAQGISFDFIGSDQLASPDLDRSPQVRVLNLRGDTSARASVLRKIARVLVYYVRLLRYAAVAEPTILHILWNNKFEIFDRTLLLLYYRLCRKRLVLTIHNVNVRERDGRDNWLNRWTLGLQYRLTDHLFVHTRQMRHDLMDRFRVPSQKISVIPFGINDTIPKTAITKAEARKRLGVPQAAAALLFFGNIAPYKGLEYLIEAFEDVAPGVPDCTLIIAGRVKDADAYWETVRHKIHGLPSLDRVVQRIEFVPDEETELYFKAADVLVLPYTHVFQSGVLSLAYSFGLPVIATDVGSLREDIVEGKTGFVCAPRDAADLASKIRTYFDSELYRSLELNRASIRRFAADRYSWAKVGVASKSVYQDILRPSGSSI